MISFTTLQLNAWLAALLWPLTRILGLMAMAPLLGSASIPPTIKICLGVGLTLIIAPAIPALPAADPMSLVGLLIIVQQFVIGLAMGFTMRIVFAAVELAGELGSTTMGLGFATFFDPQSQGRSSAISQLMALVALMLFLAENVHLAMIAALLDSFTTLPITATPMQSIRLHDITTWGATIFTYGVQLSLPIIAALLITNLGLGILTRAAPQLNLFGIGFPITLGIGLMMIAASLPYMNVPIERLFMEGLHMVSQIGSR